VTDVAAQLRSGDLAGHSSGWGAGQQLQLRFFNP